MTENHGLVLLFFNNLAHLLHLKLIDNNDYKPNEELKSCVAVFTHCVPYHILFSLAVYVQDKLVPIAPPNSNPRLQIKLTSNAIYVSKRLYSIILPSKFCLYF